MDSSTSSEINSTDSSLATNLQSNLPISYNGTVIIFNNWLFTRLPARTEAEKDSKLLTEMFIHLGFDRVDVKVCENKTVKEIQEEVQSAANCKCIIIFIMSYGINGKLYDSDDALFDPNIIKNIVQKENCPDLQGKPKLFFIQVTKYEVDIEEDSVPLTLLNCEETLISYCMVPDSLFIQCLCNVFRHHSQKLDLTSMLAKVNKMVIEDYKLDYGNPSFADIIPYYLSNLKSKFYFNPKTTKSAIIPKDRYNMAHLHRGKAIVFMNPTTPSTAELMDLLEDIEKLGFLQEDILPIDYSGEEGLKMEMAKIADLDHSESDCLLVVIFWLGGLQCLIGNQQGLPAVNIWEYLTPDGCPDLAGKPKLFFIHQMQVDDQKDEVDRGFGGSVKIPRFADFFFAYFQHNGFAESDSISCIPVPLSSLEANSNSTDFLSLFSFGNGLLYSQENDQLPCYISTLTKQIYFDNQSVHSNDIDFTSDYKMDHSSRGTVLIFNHKTFNDDLNLTVRKGTELDCKRLVNCFKNQLGFTDIRVFEDETCEAIFDITEQVSNEDFTNSDCLVLVVLSHGEFGLVFAKNNKYILQDLWEPFLRSPTLIGKPKLCFIQACQGSKMDDGFVMRTNLPQEVSQTVAEIDEPLSENSTDYMIFHNPDVLLALSTVPGFLSWKNEMYGSWFIQEFCNVLEEHSNQLDLVTMLTLVNYSVAFNHQSFTLDKETNRKMQCPCFISTLTKRLKFY